MSEHVAVLQRAVADPKIRDRYTALISPATLAAGCHPWMGAVGGRGHGRFWMGVDSRGRDAVITAHRFGFALIHGVDVLLSCAVVRHVCDEPICQTPDHWVGGSVRQNTEEWATRRTIYGSPLRDLRGSGGRSVALRNAARAGVDLDAVAAWGLPFSDRYQDPLWN